MNLFLIGSGKVATAIASNIPVCGFYTRDRFRGEQFSQKTGVPYYDNLSLLPHADLYLLSVSDDAIPAVSESLADHIDKNSVIAHTSGTKPLDSISNRFSNKGVLYPLFPFAENVDVDLKEITFFTEYSCAKSKEILSLFLKENSLNSMESDCDKRKQLHLAAVFASNFTNHLFSISQQIVQGNEYSFEILHPLIHQLFRTISTKGINIGSLQTGPAKRGDNKVIKEHLELLDFNETYKNIYNVLTQSIQKENDQQEKQWIDDKE